MYNKSIFDHLPVFVHTGVEHLHSFMNFCIENGFEWLGVRHAKKEHADHFIDSFGEDIGLFLYKAAERLPNKTGEKKSFIFDNAVGEQAKMCFDMTFDFVVEAQDYSTESKLDLSDIEKFF